jgi:transposase-like protein
LARWFGKVRPCSS